MGKELSEKCFVFIWLRIISCSMVLICDENIIESFLVKWVVRVLFLLVFMSILYSFGTFIFSLKLLHWEVYFPLKVLIKPYSLVCGRCYVFLVFEWLTFEINISGEKVISVAPLFYCDMENNLGWFWKNFCSSGIRLFPKIFCFKIACSTEWFSIGRSLISKRKCLTNQHQNLHITSTIHIFGKAKNSRLQYEL